ncbi:MAG: TetR/AcrR family transcriptional regulator, partial [bacterium]
MTLGAPDKRKQILEAAAAEFARTGYGKARIQDAAKLAGVADGTISLYFKNKEELLFELPVINVKYSSRRRQLKFPFPSVAPSVPPGGDRAGFITTFMFPLL